MNEPQVAPPPPGTGPRYSPDGRWQWDGQRWTPVQGAGQPAIIQPPRDTTQVLAGTARPASSRLTVIALVLGIGAIVVAVATWLFTFTFTASRADDVVLGLLVVVGFVAGGLAGGMALAPAPRPRGPGQIAALTCGLVGLGVLLLFVAFVMINYP